MEILKKLEKNIDSWFLIGISLVFFFLRFPSLFEPDWYGDEGVYQVLGMAMNAGRLLYRDIFDNKPPLLYFLYSLVSSDLFLIKLVSLIFGLSAVFLFFYFSRKLFKDPKTGFWTTSLFAVLFGLPLIEGNIANAENFMLALNIAAGYLVFKYSENKQLNQKSRTLLIAGFILGISFLFKVVAIFDLAAFLAFLFFINYSKRLIGILRPANFLAEVKNLVPLILGFLLPASAVGVFFAVNGAFSNFINATFFSNIAYVNYGNELIIPQGLLIIKLSLLSAFCFYIFYRRQGMDKKFIFVSLWFAFSLFDAFFSQRPYTHYILIFLPSFCLMVGLFSENKSFSKLAGVLVIASFIVIILNFDFYAKTLYYYQNFLSFITGSESVTSYQKFFDKNTPTDYELADFINLYAKPSDNVFVWGNNAQLYKLINKLPPGKYAVSYHIINYKDGYSNTKRALLEKMPKFIIIMPNVPSYPFSLSDYYQRVTIKSVQIYERFN